MTGTLLLIIELAAEVLVEVAADEPEAEAVDGGILLASRLWRC